METGILQLSEQQEVALDMLNVLKERVGWDFGIGKSHFRIQKSWDSRGWFLLDNKPIPGYLPVAQSDFSSSPSSPKDIIFLKEHLHF